MSLPVTVFIYKIHSFPHSASSPIYFTGDAHFLFPSINTPGLKGTQAWHRKSQWTSHGISRLRYEALLKFSIFNCFVNLSHYFLALIHRFNVLSGRRSFWTLITLKCSSGIHLCSRTPRKNLHLFYSSHLLLHLREKWLRTRNSAFSGSADPPHLRNMLFLRL